MKALNKLRIKNKNMFFGPGVRELLNEIERTHSIKSACENMNMSYVKALRIVRKAENEMGFPIAISQKGGHKGGGTHLSEKGKAFIAAYEEIEKEVDELAQKLVDEKLLPFLESAGDGGDNDKK